MITGKKVTNITDEGVQVEETFYPCKNIIWAAGNQASPLLKTLDVPLDRQGRVIVEPDLSIPGYPEIFVIGDASTSMDKHGKPLPGVAPVAIQEGKYVASIIKKKLPKDKGLRLSISTKEALRPSEKEKRLLGSANFNSTV